jgi:hypothetical protein
MTKREYKYIRRNKHERFWRRIDNAVSSYQLAYFKIKQLLSKNTNPSEELGNYLESLKKEVEQILIS